MPPPFFDPLPQTTLRRLLRSIHVQFRYWDLGELEGHGFGFPYGIAGPTAWFLFQERTWTNVNPGHVIRPLSTLLIIPLVDDGRTHSSASAKEVAAASIMSARVVQIGRDDRRLLAQHLALVKPRVGATPHAPPHYQFGWLVAQGREMMAAGDGAVDVGGLLSVVVATPLEETGVIAATVENRYGMFTHIRLRQDALRQTEPWATLDLMAPQLSRPTYFDAYSPRHPRQGEYAVDSLDGFLAALEGPPPKP